MAQTDFRTALQGANEIEITVTDRTSCRSLSYPVWFAMDGDKLYLIPVKGSDTDWYKNCARYRPSAWRLVGRRSPRASVFSPMRR
jgi:hypothetical protein